jgi:KEOPS complex subunit Cgi121
VLTYIQEFRKYCELTGFKNVEMNSPEAFLEEINTRKPLGVVVQFFDADVIATWQHLYFAVLNALIAFKNKENISKTLSMEIMLYASARRQIRKATQLVGIKPESLNIGALIVAGNRESAELALKRISKSVNSMSDGSVLEFSEEKTERIKRAFEISGVELETVMEKGNMEKAIVDLVIERVALLTTVH